MSAGDAGRVAVSYYGTTSGGPSPEAVTVKDAPWKVYSALSSDFGATFTETATTGTIHQGNVCTSGTGCASGTRDLLDFFETDYDATGCLVTTYTDNSRDVVSPTGQRTTNKAEWVSFVRQSGGPGLLASTECNATDVDPVVPEAPLATLLPLLAAAGLGVAVVRRRRTA